MTADDLTRLRDVAEAATPGPWTVNPNGIMVQLDLPHDSVCDVIESRSADAEFIATFDPPTVAALIDRVERAERERRDLADRLGSERLARALDIRELDDLRRLRNDLIDDGRWERVEREKVESELAALRAAVKGLADEWGPQSDDGPVHMVIDCANAADALRRLLTEGADDGQ